MYSRIKKRRQQNESWRTIIDHCHYWTLHVVVKYRNSETVVLDLCYDSKKPIVTLRELKNILPSDWFQPRVILMECTAIKFEQHYWGVL
jgi:hypothetical protein